MGVVFALVSAASYAMTFVLIRKGVRADDPDNGLMITMTVNVVVLAVTSVALWQMVPQPALTAAAIAWFIAAGLLGPMVGRNALFGGIRLIGSSRAVAIKNNAPVVVVVMAVVFLGEELSPTALAGIALVILGLLLLAHEAFTKGPPDVEPRDVEAVNWKPEGENAPAPANGIAVNPGRSRATVIAGIGLGIVAALGFGLSHVSRKVGLDISPSAVLGATIGTVAGFGSYAAVLLYQGRMAAVLAANFRTFRPLLWMAGCVSSVGILAFYLAVTMAPISHVSVVAASETILTLIFGAILQRRAEAITRRVALPALAVFGGTALIAIA